MYLVRRPSSARSMQLSKSVTMPWLRGFTVKWEEVADLERELQQPARKWGLNGNQV